MVDAVEIGCVIPDFVLQDESGADVHLYEALNASGSGVVLFVYPKASTPGCTVQACGFRDVSDTIRSHGYAIFGLSKDKATAQANWKAKHTLPFPLLCEGQDVLSQLGCLRGSSIIRSVFVILKTGRKLGFSRVKISPADSVSEVLRFIESTETKPNNTDTKLGKDPPKGNPTSRETRKTTAAVRGRPPTSDKPVATTRSNSVSRTGRSTAFSPAPTSTTRSQSLSKEQPSRTVASKRTERVSDESDNATITEAKSTTTKRQKNTGSSVTVKPTVMPTTPVEKSKPAPRGRKPSTGIPKEKLETKVEPASSNSIETASKEMKPNNARATRSNSSSRKPATSSDKTLVTDVPLLEKAAVKKSGNAVKTSKPVTAKTTSSTTQKSRK